MSYSKNQGSLNLQDKSENCDVVIIGSGPAGCSAAVYAARAGLSVVMLSGDQPGGQLTITTEVENYPGFAEPIQGPWLMDQMQMQAKNVGCKIVTEHVVRIENTKGFKSFTASGSFYTSNTLIIATGAQAKWLGIETEKKFQGYGVSGCATCDGFFFKNQDVMVVGGGNTAVEEALFLTKHAKKVYLLHRRDSLRAENVLQKRLFANDKIKVIWNNTLQEVLGKDNPLAVTGAMIKSTLDGSISKIDVNAIFIAIGHKPNTDLLEGIIDMDEEGYIITQPGSTKTSIPGIFACGDAQDKKYRQAITAAGTGCMAALDAAEFLES